MSYTLIEVPPAIYRSRNVVESSFYGKCVHDDLISKIHAPLMRVGYHLSYEGKYVRLHHAVGTETPWHHVRHLGTKRCGLDHNIKFDILGYVPPRCLECWKVVVKPRTLKELFLLLEVEEGLKRPAKCGIDVRFYSPGLYNGFFYNNSLEEGRDRYAEVRKAVDEHIGKDVPVILKRGCTEYEMIKGPSPAWVMTKKDWELDDRIENLVDTYAPAALGQTEECLAQVHTHWIEWAWKFNDPTVGEYLGGEPLYPSCVTYHEGELNAVRADLMRAKAKMIHDIEPDVVDAMHAAMRGFVMTKRIGFDKVGAVFGYDNINPLYAGEGIEIG